MYLFEISCQHICGFSNNLDILHDRIITHGITYEIIESYAFNILMDIVDTIQNILQSAFVSFTFSHKSVVCRD